MVLMRAAPFGADSCFVPCNEVRLFNFGKISKVLSPFLQETLGGTKTESYSDHLLFFNTFNLTLKHIK
ncbi:MAG: hypothetical protein JWR38_1228 [Mucilaginibacter sp.]|nr:hypothetical protein [Mucilaginibacter sp.]